ncbi:hypothetical protein [Streptomyces sp. NPDC020965]|uniref:hypothetical protein n=1 Tax=Streptomyces sp. NPDC020965 TaxID=3365105 RepID=UPI0037940D98
MAFSADELRVLRRALAIALHPTPLADEDIQDCHRLADSLDEATHEAGRLRAFLLADLVRYRDALPGSATGYLELLQDVLAVGYDPRPEDLAALRTLRGHPAGPAVLARCQDLAERSVRARLALRTAPAPRTRLLALPGGRAADEPRPQPKPKPEPAQPHPKEPVPGERPVPKPSEVFPPRRRPQPPAERLAAG